MKKSLLKKFGVYSAIGVAGGVTFGTTAAEAEIVFTDFNGAASLGNPLNIDLNNDGDVDFIFDIAVSPASNTYGSFSDWAGLAAQGANQFASTNPTPGPGGFSYGPNNLAYGDSISGQPFGPTGGKGPLQLAYQSYGTGNYGAFSTANPSGYVGVQFDLGGGDFAFGWIGVSVTGNAGTDFGNVEIVVDGFAYATNGQTITAGQTGVVPEPSSVGLLALGAAGIAARRRKNKKD